MALNLYNALETYQPNVALIARVGSDLSQYGLIYSHVGFVQRHHPAGKWIVTHLLNHCQQTTSSLFDEGLIPFFSDAPFRYQAQLIIPQPALQNELARLLNNGEAERLHENRYSVIAHAERDQFQNSNQWVLEVLAIAKSLFLPSDQRISALRLAAEQGYEPEQIKLGLFKTLGAILFSPNIRFTDHDSSGYYPVVSVRSVVYFLEKNHDLIATETINLNSRHQISSKSNHGKLLVRSRQSTVIKQAHQTSKNRSEAYFWQ